MMVLSCRHCSRTVALMHSTIQLSQPQHNGKTKTRSISHRRRFEHVRHATLTQYGFFALLFMIERHAQGNGTRLVSFAEAFRYARGCVQFN